MREAVIRPLGTPGDLGWLVMANAEVYAHEYGWDADFEGLALRIVADFATDHDPAREAGWIAELDGQRVGSILCVADPHQHQHAVLRLLLVNPAGRGRGIGGRLVDTCVESHAPPITRGALSGGNHPLGGGARHLYCRVASS